MSNPFDIFLPVFVPFVMILEDGLKLLAQATGSGGLAIILFTVFLKLLLTPLSLMQTKSMKAMQAIQPEIAALKKKYPKDRERLAQEQMRLYKEHGVNPAAGCLPMIPMMIVLIGLYQALIHLSCDPENLANISATYCDPLRSDKAFHDAWLWISNLGAPDSYHIGGIPIPGVLPILMLITQFGYGKLTPTSGPSDDPQQQMMQRMTTYFMPLMLFFFSFNFPAGLVLYWTISNLFEIFRMGITVSWDPLRPENLFGGLWGAPAAASLPASPPTKRLAARRDEDVEEDSVDADEPLNPPPGRPPGGSRKKKGKRSGKR
ncbi:MAG: membrane protein insertase YidC [Chloroflexi bacterium]|nr:membrane protein insertase YidC [Chloroflexota bacterium]